MLRIHPRWWDGRWMLFSARHSKWLRTWVFLMHHQISKSLQSESAPGVCSKRNSRRLQQETVAKKPQARTWGKRTPGKNPR
jgi:hypothetical protein